MNEKKQEHDALLKKPHHQLWHEDLDAFLEALDKHEAQEEKDRLAHGGVHNEGKAKRKKVAANPAKQNAIAKETTSTASETVPVKKRQPKEKKNVDITDLPLRERIALNTKTNMHLIEETKEIPQGKRTLKQANLDEQLSTLHSGLKRKKNDDIPAKPSTRRVRRVIKDESESESSEFSL